MSTEEFSDLSKVVTSALPKNSVHANECRDTLRLSLIWIAKYLENTDLHDCRILLQGSYGSAVEAVSLVAFGLIRPAILSLRAHYELSLQYLYYKDHPIEWRNVECFRAQPTLPGVNKKYLRDNFPDFERRLKKLSDTRAKLDEDCYNILSGVAHGTAINSISSATKPTDLIEKDEIISLCTSVFRDVGESLSDIYVSCFESNWLSLPDLTRANLEARFPGKSAMKELGI